MKKSQGLINPDRVRKLPAHYSWVDHRLVHEKYLKSLSCEGAALYLFLLCVGDREGLSYYSDKGIRQKTKLVDIESARMELIERDLVAYSAPFYQVLSLPEKIMTVENQTSCSPPPEFLSWRDSL